MNDLKKVQIAIFGATGYIGRSLLATGRQAGLKVTAFSRDRSQAGDILTAYGIVGEGLLTYSDLNDRKYDIIINATGIGSPKKLNHEPGAVFTVMEEVDKLIFDYLGINPDTRVYNMSSGAVYGLNAGGAVSSETLASFDPSNMRPGDFYALAKLCSEAKHRAAARLSIIDLRVYGFVSRWLDLEESFFISEVSKSLREKNILSTMPSDMVRDYATADDIWDVIELLYDLEPRNAAFELRSLSPVSKFELLDRLSEKFGLRYEVSSILNDQSPTGSKSAYYSTSKALASLGYAPKRTALENIEKEIKELLGG